MDIHIGIGIASEAKAYMSSAEAACLVVCDENTRAVLGDAVAKALGASVYVLPAGVQPTLAVVKQVQAAVSAADMLVAVGSGTINDIGKYASFLAQKPYVVFGTAPSMNGYASANASIVVDGHKKTLPAHVPQGIYLDIDILAQAPVRLIRSGLGDSLCRPTAQADWLLSHYVLGTPYQREPFDLLRPYEPALFEQAGALVRGDREAVTLLAQVLVASGQGMTMAGGSYPASQGEHMIAHTMEMVHGHALPQTYHGEQIGVTTLTMAAIQEQMMESGQLRVQPLNPEDEGRVLAYFGEEIGRQCWEDYQAKAFSGQKMKEINQMLEKRGEEILTALEAIMLPVAYMEQVLADAGAPVQATDLGWNPKSYGQAVLYARYSRGRFGFLDCMG